MYKEILVATDFSDPSMSALREGARLAERLGSLIVLAYVVDDRLPPLILAQTGLSSEELLERHREQAERTVTRTVERELPGRAVETVVTQGVVHEAIVRLAEERGSDLIVVGMHGHGYLTHAFVGSTAERVLHHAPCPVLIVPHDS